MVAPKKLARSLVVPMRFGGVDRLSGIATRPRKGTFVVTHSVPDGRPREDSPVTFVTDGIENALAQAKAVAGEKVVGVAGPNIAQQCLNAGLLDEILVNLVPVLLGEGIPFFGNLTSAPVKLEGQPSSRAPTSPT